MILNIVTDPSPILRRRAEEIRADEIGSPAIQKLIFDMKETVIPAGGIGLAAPQVGLSLRLIVIALDNKLTAFINPKITKFSWRKEVDEEGCLSVPGKFGPVKRSKVIKVETFDEQGKLLKFKAGGLFARVIQHEVDHLDGILFIDKAKKVITDSAPRI
jgi:peptide deformylase